MPLLKPDYYIQNFKTIDLSRLKAQGIRLLLCDIDNTLTAFDSSSADLDVQKFIRDVEEAGIQVALMSNNVAKRTDDFAKNNGVKKVYSFSLKPFPFTFKKAMKQYKTTPDQTAIIGDQLFTDILGGNLSGLYTILSAPISERERPDTAIMRALENAVYWYYNKKNIFKRGDFDE
ncbi:MAG: YqeG family HAD IIIA-type phosphatase [Ileibacterium sp.]|nr:YqeG family HAD IIIA-type phosphatase [Ileibacterium sp.]